MAGSGGTLVYQPASCHFSEVLAQQHGWAASYFQLWRYEDISVEQGTLHQDHQHGVFAPCQLAALVPNQGVPRKWDMVLTIKDFN